MTLAAEAYLAIPNVWALERFIKKATPKVINSEKPQDIPSTIYFNFCRNKYETCVYGKFDILLNRARNKDMQILLSNRQAGPGRKVKQEQEEISRNHVQAF